MIIREILKIWFVSEPEEYKNECIIELDRYNREKTLKLFIATWVIQLIILLMYICKYLIGDITYFSIIQKTCSCSFFLVTVGLGIFAIIKFLPSAPELSQLVYSALDGVLLVWAAIDTLIMQEINGSLSNYIIVCYLVTFLLTIRPSYAMVAQLFSSAILCIALPIFQKDSAILHSQLFRVLFVLLSSIYISRINYKSRISSIVNNVLIENQNAVLNKLATTDELTGIYNRRKFNEIIKFHWNNAIRSQYFISMIIFDIDYFKQYNDTYGHLEGDRLLKKVSNLLADNFRRSSEAYARFGGEEFVIILSYCDEKRLEQYCQNLISEVDKLSVPHKTSQVKDNLTISAGAVCIKPQVGDTIENFINSADIALYKAKNKGRHCYVIGEFIRSGKKNELDDN